jgi:Fe-S cluster biogenesis protein NfuA
MLIKNHKFAGMSEHTHNKADVKSRVEQALNQIRPYLEADGGDVSLHHVSEDMVVQVELHGACKTCNMSRMTMKAGVEDVIRRAVPEVLAVEAISNHS